MARNDHGMKIGAGVALILESVGCHGAGLPSASYYPTREAAIAGADRQMRTAETMDTAQIRAAWYVATKRGYITPAELAAIA